MGAGMTAWVWVGGRGGGHALVGVQVRVRVRVRVRCAKAVPCGAACCAVWRSVWRDAARARARNHAGVRATECERDSARVARFHCTPEPLRAFARRRTHPNFNSQHFSSFYSSAQRWSKRRGYVARKV